MKKGLILTLAMVMAFCIGIGSTLAYLFVETQQVVNTFEYGDIDITLEETGTTTTVDGNNTKTFKMIPGDILAKDPKVTVLRDSEACWLFVEIDESTNFGEFMTYEVVDGWTAFPGKDGVYYREVAASSSDQPFNVLKDNKVLVKDTVTKTMLNASDFENPTLTFTAYAVQKANVATVEDAWALVKTKGVPASN